MTETPLPKRPRSRPPTTIDSLPADVLTKILSGFPIPAIVTFTSVCKSWQSTISHPNFIITHFNRLYSSSNDADKFLITECSSTHQQLCTLRCGNCLVELSRFRIPFDGPRSSFRILGACNGLLCLTESFLDEFGRTIFLWNPTVRKFKALRRSLFRELFDSATRVFLGFGYDQGSNEFKIVRIMYFLDEKRSYFGGRRPKAEIYNLGSDSWSRIWGDVPLLAIGDSNFSKAVVEGAIHWLASKRSDGRVEVIMSFGIEDELFGELSLPEFDQRRVRLSIERMQLQEHDRTYLGLTADCCTRDAVIFQESLVLLNEGTSSTLLLESSSEGGENREAYGEEQRTLEVGALISVSEGETCTDHLAQCTPDCATRCTSAHPGGNGYCYSVLPNYPVCYCDYDCGPTSPPSPAKRNCNAGLGLCTVSCNAQCCNQKCAAQYNNGVGFCNNLGEEFEFRWEIRNKKR
ncbi:hypothetical protein RJ639_036881 [Escallonia herrerae]|uniref:F-box domain-containing protein n=1 Tax=Escallonia herrerae TaxID=1293975 RepID=A0AA88WNV7_9ASTE|nr:hypothetical protein RJ639_036881 [Escallonia herrerae]